MVIIENAVMAVHGKTILVDDLPEVVFIVLTLLKPTSSFDKYKKSFGLE